MVNRGSEDFDAEQWYPQMLDGYEEQDLYGWGRTGFPPGYGMQGYFPGQDGFGQGIPGFPPGPGIPGFPPGQGIPGFPPGQQQGSQPPRSAPPSGIPAYPSTQLFAVDPGAIRGCLFRFTFIWLSRRRGFWFFPVFVGRRSVAGWRWRSRQRRWVYMGIDLDNIDRFSCY